MHSHSHRLGSAMFAWIWPLGVIGHFHRRRGINGEEWERAIRFPRADHREQCLTVNFFTLAFSLSLSRSRRSEFVFCHFANSDEG